MRRRTAPFVATLVLGAVAAACGGGRSVAPGVEPWPEADALFHQDPRWRGADDAFSVDLGTGRAVWLFADTAVATSARRTRAESCVVRNSVGLMTGSDPEQAAMTFHWRRGGDGAPESFFPRGADACYPARDDAWFWPGDGERLGADGPLLVFLLRIRRDPAAKPPWDFDGDGWAAVRIPNPDADPSDWRVERAATRPNPWNIVVGSGSVLARGDWLYAFATREPTFDVYLARWPLSAAAAGDLSSPEWWTGEARGGFVEQSELDGAPKALFRDGQPEFTVHEVSGGGLVAVQTIGFGAATIGYRTAPSITGPWSDVREVWRPPESSRKGALVYGAKAHPEIDADGALAVTYIASNFDLKTVLADESLYYPRFVRLRLER